MINRIGSFFLVALLALALPFVSCGQSDSTSQSSSSATENNNAMNSFGLEPLEPAREARDESLGEKTISGKLVVTKGNRAMVDGVILANAYVFVEGEGKTWKPELEALKNRRVVVTGDVLRHWCGPHEQCLEQGYIDTMIEVTEFRKK